MLFKMYFEEMERVWADSTNGTMLSPEPVQQIWNQLGDYLKSASQLEMKHNFIIRFVAITIIK